MSDSERSKSSATPPDDASLTTVPITKRVTGSCDTCRRRKVKCDSQGNRSGPCTNCRVHKIPCTHDTPVKKRGMKDYSRKVSMLHQRVAELEESLKQHDPQEVASLQQCCVPLCGLSFSIRDAFARCHPSLHNRRFCFHRAASVRPVFSSVSASVCQSISAALLPHSSLCRLITDILLV
ncbi:hypothetical protein BDZ89DRAFT_438449 [Hymenopellis radicata]|nr:hypothetical protein BDZ89DRAFT_438449 [Hymenopellis radicata]